MLEIHCGALCAGDRGTVDEVSISDSDTAHARILELKEPNAKKRKTEARGNLELKKTESVSKKRKKEGREKESGRNEQKGGCGAVDSNNRCDEDQLIEKEECDRKRRRREGCGSPNRRKRKSVELDWWATSKRRRVHAGGMSDSIQMYVGTSSGMGSPLEEMGEEEVAGFKLVHCLCLWIGWLITYVLLGTVNGVIWVVTNSAVGLTVLLEDFLLFLEDLGEAVEWTVVGLTENVVTALEGICSTIGLIIYGLTTVPTTLRDLIMSFKLGTYLVNLVVLVKDAVLLLGICFWEFFTWVYAALVYLNEAPYILLLLLARVVENAAGNLLFILEAYWFRSVCGLALGCGSYLLAKNTGILPEIHFWRITLSGSKRCRHEISRTVRILIMCAALLVSLLKCTAHSTLDFLRKQVSCVKGAVRAVYREFVCHTPTKAALQIKLEKEKASSQCVVCMDRRRDVMILSCRHLLMCKQCALTVAVGTGECPVCRTPIDNIISVYT